MGLKPEDGYTAQLQVILRVAHDLREVAAISPPSEHSIPSCNPAAIDSIRLPNPLPLFPLLVEAGFGHETALAANKIYLQHAEGLRCRIQESIFSMWRKIAELPVNAAVSSPDLLISKVVSTSTEIYFRRLEQWKEDIIQRIKQASYIPPKVTSKNTFNHEYVPLLERFFEENPFPTRTDKMYLAKKTNMQFTQIHVWFQNRRTRIKKDGKVLKKKPIYEETKPPGNRCTINNRKVGSASQTHRTSKIALSEGASEEKATRNNTPKDAFASSVPLHAFPASYPPICYYDPFPCKNGPARFQEPEWRHALSRVPPPPSISLDELADRFSLLSVRDDSRIKELPKLRSQAATAAITVVPSRAPHPALILSKYPQSPSTVQRYPVIRAAVSSSEVFKDTSSASQPVTLVPLSTPPKKLKHPDRRKTAPLPRHFPSQIRNACRDVTPSESSSTSSPSPRSSPADFGSRNYSPSSISSLSTASHIATPQELPYCFGSPYHSLFDSPHLGIREMATIA